MYPELVHTTVPSTSYCVQGWNHGGLLSISTMVTLMMVEALNEGFSLDPSGVSLNKKWQSECACNGFIFTQWCLQTSLTIKRDQCICHADWRWGSNCDHRVTCLSSKDSKALKTKDSFYSIKFRSVRWTHLNMQHEFQILVFVVIKRLCSRDLWIGIRLQPKPGLQKST